MTTIIGFVSQKGGVGKSTLARVMAYEATKNGLEVKIADLDTQQGTVADWHRHRLDTGHSPVGSVEVYKSAAQALKVAEQYDLLILDGAARASAATLEIAQVADLIVQPTGASRDDLKPAVLLFHEMVKAKIPKDKLVLVLSRVGTETELQEARTYIEQAGYSVLEGCLYERPAYRQAQNEGLTITETRYKSLNGKADQIVQNLTDRIYG